MKVTKFLSSGS